MMNPAPMRVNLRISESHLLYTSATIPGWDFEDEDRGFQRGPDDEKPERIKVGLGNHIDDGHCSDGQKGHLSKEGYDEVNRDGRQTESCQRLESLGVGLRALNIRSAAIA